MIRPHTPSDTPAEKPAHSGQNGGVWASPWGLDHEWQDAPPARKRRLIKEDEPAERPPERRTRPMAQTPETKPEPPVPRATVPVRQAPPPRSPHLPPPSEREVSWSTLAVLSLALLVCVFIAWVYLDDPEFGADEDLRLRRPVDQSATIQTPEKLRRFLDSLVPFEDTTLYGKSPWQWDTPALSRIVQSNGAALDNLRDLLEDADWHPAHSAWHAADPCGDPRWHQALRLKQAEAAYLSRRMQEEEAFTAAIDLAEIGWRLEPLWAWPSCYQRSLEAQTYAAQTLADLLRQTKLSEATLRQFQRQFSVCQPSVELLAGAMNAFYVHEKKLILGPKSGELADTMPGGAQLRRPGRLFFKPNETVQLFAHAFRQLRDEAKAPLAQTSEVRLKNVPGGGGSFQPNTEGQVYFTRRMKTYTPLPAFLGLVRARGNLIVTLFAIRRCIAEKKTLPATLEQLRTFNYLLDVPVDPYTGAPLQYNLARGLLWSVGNHLKSAGGVSTEPDAGVAGAGEVGVEGAGAEEEVVAAEV
jgi:hypothetical protein